MKKITIWCMLVLFGLIFELSAQNYKVVRNDLTGMDLQISTKGISISEISTIDEVFSRIDINGYLRSNQVGNPELPVMVKMIEIPLCEEVSVSATAGSVKTYPATAIGLTHRLYPAQRSVFKSEEGPFPTIINEDVYSTNDFYGSELATVQMNGIMRSYNLATVYINPVKYNPVTNEIMVYDDITVKINYEHADIDATRAMKEKHTSCAFGLPAQVINSLPLQQRDLITTTPVKYLIVANDMFNGQLDSLINWKKRKGFLVEVAYTGTIGTTTTAIKNYIQSLYDNATPTNPAPTYVLFVGDVAQMPAFSGQTDNHITDLYYCTWTGNDLLPECYFGRFSAQNVSQLTPQIEKTLIYEQCAMPDLSYLDDALIIAGQDQGRSGDFGYSHANPTMHYLEDTYLTSSYGYSSVTSLYNPHNSSASTTIKNTLNSGVGYANYSAHCSPSGWGSPSFTTSNVSSMTNAGKFGLMIGNCCQSNDFSANACFGEALLRLNNKGAVGYIGGTNSTIWDEDFYWAVGVRRLSYSCSNCNTASYDANALGAYDKLFHTHNESYADWFITQGSMVLGGNMAVQASNSSYKEYYWEIYSLMGDPSVMPWLTVPDDMNILIDGNAVQDATYEMEADLTELTIATGAPYTYVALTHNLTLITAALSDASGNVTLSFPTLEIGETYELAASAQNHKTTFINIVPIAPVTVVGARVIITNVEPTNGAIASINSAITLDVTIANNYLMNAINTIINASTTSPYIQLTDATENVGTVVSGSTSTLSAAFAINIDEAPENTVAPIQFMVIYSNNGTLDTTTYTYNLIIKAPAFCLDNYSLTQVSGNNDNIVNPGECFTLTITNSNCGSTNADNVVSELSTYYVYAAVATAPIQHNTLNTQTACNSTFTININNDVPNGTLVPYFHHIYCANNPVISRIDTIYVVVGSATYTEDWESNSFATNGWDNNSSYPWTITSSNPYAGSYCAKSGNSSHHNTTSELTIDITVTQAGNISYYRKVSSEAGYDIFKFYIDEELQEEQSGTISWGAASFPISAGTHTLTFSFTKDRSVSSGYDCAWIDNITWPHGQIAPHVAAVHITDAAPSQGTTPIAGANVTFDAALENIGDAASAPVTLTLSTTSTDITLTDDTEVINSVAALGTHSLTAAFAGTINPDLQNDATANFTLIASYIDNGLTRTDTFHFTMDIYASFLPIINVANNYYDTICINGQTQLYVSRIAGTEETPTFQWYRDGNQLSGETQSTLQVSGLAAGTYRFHVAGTINDETRNSTDLIITVLDIPTIGILGDATVCQQATATLTAQVQSNMAFNYTWYLNSTRLDNETGAQITTEPSLAAGSHTYQVEAWNHVFDNNCMATSSKTIMVQAAPTILTLTSSANNNMLCQNEEVTFAATSDDAQATFVWTHNGTPVANETADTYTTQINHAGAHTYTVTAQNGQCSSAAESTTITVNALPAAVLSAGGNIGAVCMSNASDMETLTINFAGNAPYTFTLTNLTNQTSEDYNATGDSYSIPVHPETSSDYQITALTDNNCSTTEATGNIITVLTSSFTVAEENAIISYNGGTPGTTFYFINNTPNDYRTTIPFEIDDYNHIGFTQTSGNLTINGNLANAYIEMPVTAAGTYRFAIIIDGCSYDVSVTIQTTGIHENMLQNISLFPNPTTSDLHITISDNHNQFSELNYTVFDVCGKLMQSGRIENYHTIIPLNQLSSGMYFIQISTNSRILFHDKVIKK